MLCMGVHVEMLNCKQVNNIDDQIITTVYNNCVVKGTKVILEFITNGTNCICIVQIVYNKNYDVYISNIHEQNQNKINTWCKHCPNRTPFQDYKQFKYPRSDQFCFY